MSLTHKQRELLTFIDTQTTKNGGVCPSFDEMTEALGLRSKSGVHRIIEALEGRGFIRRIPNRARAIEVIRRPGDPAPIRSDDTVDRYRAALLQIAAGDGVYGAQAGEYKAIARKALGMPT